MRPPSDDIYDAGIRAAQDSLRSFFIAYFQEAVRLRMPLHHAAFLAMEALMDAYTLMRTGMENLL